MRRGSNRLKSCGDGDISGSHLIRAVLLHRTADRQLIELITAGRRCRDGKSLTFLNRITAGDRGTIHRHRQCAIGRRFDCDRMGYRPRCRRFSLFDLLKDRVDCGISGDRKWACDIGRLAARRGCQTRGNGLIAFVRSGLNVDHRPGRDGPRASSGHRVGSGRRDANAAACSGSIDGVIHRRV